MMNEKYSLLVNSASVNSETYSPLGAPIPPTPPTTPNRFFDLLTYHKTKARSQMFRTKVALGILLLLQKVIIGGCVVYVILWDTDLSGLFVFEAFIFSLLYLLSLVFFVSYWRSERILDAPIKLAFVYDDSEEALAAYNQKASFLRLHWKRIGSECLNCCLPLCIRSPSSMMSDLEGNPPIAFFTTNGVYLSGNGIISNPRSISIVAVQNRYYIEVNAWFRRYLVLIPKFNSCFYPSPDQPHPSPIQASLETLFKY